jgi:hypothetical protein
MVKMKTANKFANKSILEKRYKSTVQPISISNSASKTHTVAGPTEQYEVCRIYLVIHEACFESCLATATMDPILLPSNFLNYMMTDDIATLLPTEAEVFPSKRKYYSLS